MIFFGLQHIREESKQLRKALRENSNVTHFRFFGEILKFILQKTH